MRPLLSTELQNITAEVSPIASAQFSRFIGEVNGTSLNETQLEIVRGHLSYAAKKGIKLYERVRQIHQEIVGSVLA